MKFNSDNKILTFFLEGHIDSSNAEETEKYINEIIEKQQFEELVFDLDTLNYISSAGLRMILREKKTHNSLKLINASSEVYDVLEMTGFTEMLTVEKAYRKLSIDNCEVIGQGANGKVYRLDNDTIIKVYFNHDALPDIHRERDLARKAFVLGIPTAIPYDVVKVGDLYGSVFELLNAKSFSKLIVGEPENKDKYIGLYTDLLKKIHSTEVKPTDMPDMKAVSLEWARFVKDYLPDADYEKLVSMIEAVPDDNHMIHGDYHIKNVMMQNGEVLLIDMDTLCHGNPVFEFASIFNAYVGFNELDKSVTKEFMGVDCNLAEEIWNKTLRLYFNTEDEKTLESYINKARIIGYTRLLRRTIKRVGIKDSDGKKMIEHYRKNLINLLAKEDSLAY